MSESWNLTPIRARVSDGALDKVTRLFAGLSDACVELLQNARRAGATAISVRTEALEHATRVTVTDNGTGIADPQILLTLGESAWGAAVARAEDPAGFGLLSLSRNGCTVRWRVACGTGYRLALEPDHFIGRKAALAEPDNDAPSPHGTAVSFETGEAPTEVRTLIEAAARHYPLPVALNDQIIARRAFLNGALHAEHWRGLVFGVYTERHPDYRSRNVNFHGLTLYVPLPVVETIGGPLWSVRVDIDACPELELVLPSRKEALETPFLETLREAARRAIYRAMEQADTAPQLPWKEWRRAADAGIVLPIPAARLLPWRPPSADVNAWRSQPEPVSVARARSMLVTAELEPPEAQTFYRAAGRNALAHDPIAERLFQEEPRYEGFDWYDQLPCLETLRTAVHVEGAIHSPAYFKHTPVGDDEPIRPDAIQMALHITQPPRGDVVCHIHIPADVVFANEAWCWITGISPLVLRNAEISADELTALIMESYFCPADDAEADAYDTQQNAFAADAQHLAVTLLEGDDEALILTIADVIRHEILWRLPPERNATITIRGDDIDARLNTPPEP